MGDMPTLPTIHVISDSMGNTAKTIARSAASHFGELDPNITVLPYVRSFDQIRSFLEEEQRLHRQMYNDDRIIVYYTLVIQELRDALESYLADHPNIYAVDVLSDSIAVIEQVSGKTHNPAPGEQHKINDQYFQRIEAIEFTVSHDDGLLTQDLPEADIVILGVSRTSKTPTSIYLGQQGYKVANVPLVEGLELPKEVYEVDRERLFGLITDPSVLVGVRKTRMGGQLGQSRYADIDAVTLELDRARTIMRGLGCVIINTKDRAIEETAQEILRHYNAAFPRIPSPHGSFVLPV
ncbi:MAG: kinase/pyrophosphorylase [Coriobacteriia bacterium]|nr:MAG: kinase/pyrophosphorylase [Coriobacteriia bacterium]HJJ00324.1 kinase/pyrophosphorylase [Coriobacteriaceae bacterium]